jgi:dihydroorotate dehydrogenase electron transfer subunit
MVVDIITYKIQEVRAENSKIKTFSFHAPKIAKKAKPGNFVMVWIPGVDEIPISISNSHGENIEITVKAVGEASNSLCSKKVGEYIGLRGPHGNGFRQVGKSMALIAGGYGVSPLIFFAEKAKGKKFFIFGAKTKDDFILLERIKKLGATTELCTNDGSLGKRAMATQLLEELLKKEKIDAVYTCGPELMMKKVFELAENKKVHCQASLERWMKCGVGVCSSCAMDPTGWMVCKDGPVADNNILRKLGEFGNYKRNKYGEKIYL